MAVASIKDVPLEARIAFRSKNPKNTVLWSGKLIGISTLSGVRGYGNLQPENEAVRQIDPSVPSDTSLLTYFLLEVHTQGQASKIYAFADQWIKAGTLQILDTVKRVSLIVEDPFNDPQRLVAYLASATYIAKLT